jgi:hypothetical protein
MKQSGLEVEEKSVLCWNWTCDQSVLCQCLFESVFSGIVYVFFATAGYEKSRVFIYCAF